MSKEDVIQISDVAWLDVSVTGTSVVVNAKQGPIATVSAPANGQLEVTLSEGIPAADFSYGCQFMQSALLTHNIRNQSDTLKTFDITDFPAATARATLYRAKFVLRRKVG